MTREIPINGVVFREDLYPRFEPDQALIQKYAYCLEQLPPIKVNQNMILIDGFHRWKAHQLEKKETIKAEVIELPSEEALMIMAFKTNSTHGQQLTPEEKQKFARKMYGVISDKEIIETLSINEKTYSRWTTTQRENTKKERDATMLDLYLRCWTQREIADEVGADQKTVCNFIDALRKNGQMSEIPQGFTPYLYNIWNLQKQDNVTDSHFGSFPQVFMENLLYYHTEQFQIVYDPFAGGGTTVDACRKWMRRFYCTDRAVKPGREKDIFQWDIKDGLPDKLIRSTDYTPDLVFLDPPYWLLANKEYSKDDDDLGNMSKDDFYKTFHTFVEKLIEREIKKIAYVIRPIWIIKDGNWEWENPMDEMKYIMKQSGKYKVDEEYDLPYSTQQYSGLWVDRAKKNKKNLITTRYLTIFKRTNGKI